MSIQERIQQLAIEADRYLEEQNYEEAIKSCDEIIRLDPNFKEAYSSRGFSYANLEKNDKAIIDFDKAINIDPDFAEAYNNRGLAYNDLGKYNEALIDFDKAIELDPNFKEAYNNRGFSYNNLGRYDKATIDLNKAIRLDGKFKDAYLNRGISYSQLENFDKAIIDFDKAIEINPTYAKSYYNRGFFYKNLKKYDKAIINFTKAIELDPNFKEAYFNRALICQKLREHNKAIIDYTKVIKLDPNFKEAYFNRALVYAELKEYDKTLEDFTRYVEYTDKVIYKLYFLLVNLYKTKKINKDKIADLIKKIINKQTSDTFKSKKTNRDKTTDEIIDIIKNKNGEQINIDLHTLYSYVPFDKNTIDAIVQGYKYANEIFDFNDPTDPTIKLIGDTEEMTEILKNIRIACFSTSPLNVLMYSHYTDKHKGICIEYDFSDFDTENTSLLEVKYKEELKIDSEISQIMMKSDNDINEEISFLDLFRTKHLNWEYEKEYRVMTYDVDKIYRPIKAIYLGKDISDSDIELIKTLIKGRSIKLYQVALHEYNVFRLEATEIMSG